MLLMYRDIFNLKIFFIYIQALEESFILNIFI